MARLVPHLSVLLPHHILSHLEGAEVLVHVLDLGVLGGVLTAVQQLGDGVVIVVDHTAFLSVLTVAWQRQDTHYTVNHTHSRLCDMAGSLGFLNKVYLRRKYVFVIN